MIEAKDFKINLGSDIESLKDDVTLNVINNPAVKKVILDLQMSDAEVEEQLAALICLYEEDLYCAKCPGLEKCEKDYQRYRLSLRRDGREIVREYSLCPVALQTLERKSRFMIADFPKDWLTKELKDVDITSNKRKKLVMALSASIRNKNGAWFYVTGNNKSGKSFIMAAYGSSYAKHIGRGVVFTNFSNLCGDLSNLYMKEKDKFYEKMEKLINAPLVIIDDFGNEFLNDVSFTNIVFPLVHERSIKGLPVCFISDFKFEDFPGLYNKINPARVNQLMNLIKEHTGAPYDVSGVSLYNK